jgi:hypothetical protein
MTITQTARPTRYRLIAVAIAVGVALAIWAVTALAGIELIVTSPLVGALTINAILVVVSVVPLAFAAWGVLALLERRSSRGRTLWTRIAIAVLVLSVPPLALLDATLTTKLILATMHIAVGLVLIVMLRRRA